MQTKSSSSVVIKSIDRNIVRQAVEDYAQALRENHPEVRRVIWFGSWVAGTPRRRSDVDICIIVDRAPEKPRDRIPKYLPTRFPTGVDLFVYTPEELARLKQKSPGWYQAIASGVDV